jgi:hypothetical protein
MTALPLDELQRRIAQQEAALGTLRSMQTQLADLVRRKDELLEQVQEIDAQIHALNWGKAAPARAKASHPRSPGKARGSRRAASGELPTAAEMIVQILREAGGGPVPVRDLAREARRRGLRSRSKNFRKVIEIRTTEMVRNGMLSRAPNRAGLVLKTTAAEPRPKRAAARRKAKPGASSRGRRVAKRRA